MRLAGWLAGGAIAALLLAAPAGGQIEDADGFGIRMFPDDLQPAPSLFGINRAEEARWHYIRREMMPAFPNDLETYMIAISNQEEDPPDFAIGLSWTGTQYALFGHQLAFSTTWYSALYRERLDAQNPAVFEDAAASRRAEELALQLFTDTRENAADTTRIRSVKQAINRQLRTHKAESCQAPVSEELAIRIDRVFSGMIERTRVGALVPGDPDADIRADFLFGTGHREGIAKLPVMAGGRPALMIRVGTAMHDYCRTREARHLDILRLALDALEKRLPDGSK